MRTRRWRRVLLAVALLLSSTVVGLALAELVMRWREPPPVLSGVVDQERVDADIALYVPAPPPLYFAPAPERTSRFGATNRLGLRDHEYALAKPAGTFRVVVLGDSITWGPGIPLLQTFENLVEARLRGLGHCVEVINLGVPGYNAQMEEAYLVWRGLPLAPDLVVAVIGLNDQTETPVVLWEADAMRFVFADTHHRDDVPWLVQLPGGLDRWLMQNSAVVRALFRALAAPDTPLYEKLKVENRLALHRIAARAEEAGARAAFVLLPNLEDWSPYALQADHDDLATTLRGWGSTVIDLLPGLREALASQGTTIRLNPQDNLHLDLRGHEVVARLLADAFTAQGLVPAAIGACPARGAAVDSAP